MATLTATYSFNLPDVGGDLNNWGGFLNANWEAVEDLLDGTDTITPDLASGWKVSGTVIDTSAAQINYLQNVTSDVQTQLDNKQDENAALTSIADLNIVTGKILFTIGVDQFTQTTITAAGRAIIDDVDAAAQRVTLGLGTAATKDIIDEDTLESDSATRPPSQQSVKAYVDNRTTERTTVDLGLLSAGLNTEAHGLGATPTEVAWYLECTSPDSNFGIGDRVFMSSWQTQADDNDAFTVWATSTLVGFALVGDVKVADKNSSSMLTLTAANWDVYVTAKV